MAQLEDLCSFNVENKGREADSPKGTKKTFAIRDSKSRNRRNSLKKKPCKQRQGHIPVASSETREKNDVPAPGPENWVEFGPECHRWSAYKGIAAIQG